MSERVARLVRKQTSEVKTTTEELVADLGTAIQNELITRGRVEALERRAKVFDKMGPWEKLKWLLRRP